MVRRLMGGAIIALLLILTFLPMRTLDQAPTRAASSSTFQTIAPNGDLSRERFKSDAGEGAEIADYFQYRFDQMKDASGAIPDGAQMKALAQRATMERQRANGLRPYVVGIDNLSWTNSGPGNVGGRIRAILPISAATVFVGGVSGGIWKTTNCCSTSTTWTPLNDFLANLAVSSLILDPTDANVMYAGTGEGFFNVDAVRGAGVFKSTDGGATWNQLASTNNSSWYFVNRLAISPNGATLLAATNTGIYRSTDGGSTWTRVESSSYYKDVKFDPTDSTKAIASRANFQVRYSTDGGVTWLVATGVASGTSALDRVELAYAPSNPSIVYASAGPAAVVYKSTDGGHTYALVNADAGYQASASSQYWYDNTLWVDPTDPNHVVGGGLDLYQSTDGGTTFTKISDWTRGWPDDPPSPHADHHALVSIPGSSTALLNGNDGGLMYTSNILTAGNNPPGYNNGWVYLNNNLGITQFYGVSGNGNGVLYGGAQDNGVARGTPGAPNAWTYAFGGDGGKAVADPTNPNYLYSEYTNAQVHRSSNGGSSADFIYGTYYNGSAWVCRAAPYRIDDACNGAANFIAPILLDPNNANRLLVGGLSLWVTNDARTPYVYNSPTGGPQWTAIKASIGSNIVSIAVAPSNSNVIWVGYANSRIDMTTDGGATWTRVDTNIGANKPGTQVGAIAIDRNNSNIVYVGFTGFGANRAWRTADGGTTWTNITSNLPQAPIYAFAINPSNAAWLYVGTEIGIFASVDTGATWNVPAGAANGDGPANVATFDLQWMGGGNSTGSTILIAGTHGRGAWTVDVSPSSNVNTYADPGLVCGGNSPCYATIGEAMTNVASGGTVTIYAGTYLESVTTASRTVTVNVVGDITVNDLSLYNNATWNGGSYAITVNNFNLFGGIWNADSSTLTVNGDWTGGGTFNAGTGASVFAKNGVVTANVPAQTEGTLSFCNLAINANTTVDTTDDFISAATGGACTQFTQNGKLRRVAPQQTVINFGAFTFKDARNRDAVILQKQSGNSLFDTNITITSNQQPPSACGVNPFPTTPVLRQFDLTSSGGTAPYGPYRMRLYFSANDPNEANGNTVVPPYTLAIYHCNGTSWEKYVGSGGSDANGVYVESSAATWSTGSIFAIGASGANVYYSQGSLNAGALASWNTSRGGGGSQPANFNGPDYFVIQNGHSMTTGSAFTLSHADSLLQIESGGALTVNTADISVMGAQVDSGGTLTINSGRALTINNGSRAPDMTVSGTLVNAGTVTMIGTGSFGAGSVYQHARDGGTIPTEAWNVASTVLFTGIISSVPSPFQAFGNVTWNSTGQTANMSLSGNLATVNGNLTVTSTGTGSVRLANSATATNNVAGNVLVNGGTLYVSGSSGALTLNVGGNLTVSSGNFYISGASGTTNPTVNVAGNVILNGGTLRPSLSTGVSTLNVAGNWTNSSSFIPDYSTVAFNGSAAQSIGGSVDTTFAYLTIVNTSADSAGVSLGRNTVVNNLLTLTDGLLKVAAYNLTLGAGASISHLGSTASMVVTDVDGAAAGDGFLCKGYSGNGSFEFPVGDAYGATEYSPSTLNFTADLGASTVCVRVTNARHPNWPGANYPTYITRYWTATSTDSTFTCAASFTYTDGDVVLGGTPAQTEADLYHKVWDGASWTTKNQADVDTNTLSSVVNSFSDHTAFSGSPLAAMLASFDAEAYPDHILVTWETVSELGNLGFNLYRGASATGPERQLNQTLIPSQSPGSSNGFVYTWEDAADLVPGVTYYYWVEALDIYGVTTRYGPVSVDYTTPTAVRLVQMSATPTWPRIAVLLATAVLLAGLATRRPWTRTR
ncbi:hypothetical protein [Candidatus Amarolinea aalborgensis]|uniref:hypothetical protein n=1 Tax=Candidatus Amarolinea aalborgensis TaxID=2249329 RepID=UPI003BF94570